MKPVLPLPSAGPPSSGGRQLACAAGPIPATPDPNRPPEPPILPPRPFEDPPIPPGPGPDLPPLPEGDPAREPRREPFPAPVPMDDPPPLPEEPVRGALPAPLAAL